MNWQFDEIQSNRYQGINDSGLETFSGNAVKSLTREIIQNSLDAVKDESRPVRINFKVSKIETAQLPGIESHIEAIKQCVMESKEREDKKAHRVFKQMYEKYTAEFINVLVISDYNTTGLTKIEEGRGSFDSLVKSEGYSYKESAGAGGSFGIGKNAAFVASSIRTVFYNTLNLERERGFQGVTILTSHKSPENDKIRLAKGFFPIEPITSPHEYFKSILNRDEPGTDVIIVGFNNDDFEKTCSDVIVNNFFMSLEKNKLQVEVNETFISKESYGSIITKNYKESLTTNKRLSKRIKDQYEQTFDLYTALSENSFIKTISIDDHQDSIEVFITTSKVRNMKNEFIGIRSTGMNVHTFNKFSTKLNFVGIVYIESTKLNDILKLMENPLHNKWESERHPNGKKDGLIILRQMRLAVSDVIKTIETEIDDDNEFITGLNDLFNSNEYRTPQKKIKVSQRQAAMKIENQPKINDNSAYLILEKIYGGLTPVEKKKLEIDVAFKYVNKNRVDLLFHHYEGNKYRLKFKSRIQGNYYIEFKEVTAEGSSPFIFVKHEIVTGDLQAEQHLGNGLICSGLEINKEYELEITVKNKYRSVVEVNVYHVEK